RRLAIATERLHVVHGNEPRADRLAGRDVVQGGSGRFRSVVEALVAQTQALQQMAASHAVRSPQINGTARLTAAQRIERGSIAPHHEIIEGGRRCREDFEYQLLCHVSAAARFIVKSGQMNSSTRNSCTSNGFSHY